MGILLDAEDYRSFWYILSPFMLAAVALTLLLVNAFALLIGDPSLPWICPATVAIFLLVLVVFSIDGLMNSPLRVYEGGISINPLFSLRPKFIPFNEIKEITLDESYIYGRSSYTVRTASSGIVQHTERFQSSGGAKRFAQRLSEILHDKGFRASPPRSRGFHARYVFVR